MTCPLAQDRATLRGEVRRPVCVEELSMLALLRHTSGGVRAGGAAKIKGKSALRAGDRCLGLCTFDFGPRDAAWNWSLMALTQFLSSTKMNQ